MKGRVSKVVFLNFEWKYKIDLCINCVLIFEYRGNLISVVVRIRSMNYNYRKKYMCISEVFYVIFLGFSSQNQRDKVISSIYVVVNNLYPHFQLKLGYLQRSVHNIVK